jgi:hypothetical protein
MLLAAGGLAAACGGSASTAASSSPGQPSPATTVTTTAPAPVTSVTSTAPTPALGLSPTSVTFVSADVGWVLGTVACSAGRCTRVEQTTDGGAQWTPVASPPGSPTGIRFASATIGYAYGLTQSPLDLTRDGGASWSPVSAPDSEQGVGASDLEVGSGVWLLGQGPYPDVLYAAIGSASFHKLGSAPNRSGVLAVQAGEAYVLGPQGAGPISPGLAVVTTAGQSGRTVPCTGVDGNGDAGALTPLVPAGQLVVACVPQTTSSGAPATALYRSTDDGRHWSSYAQVPACDVVSLTRTSTAVFAACQRGGVERVPLTGGTAATSLSGGGVLYVGFTTDSDGVAVLQPASATGDATGTATGNATANNTLEITRDGGAHWVKAPV